MSGAVANLQKPQLRGLLHSQIKKTLIIAIGMSLVCGAAYKFLVSEPRKQKYANFYK